MISISGESGSGKTETNKQCLKIISYVCESHIKTTEMLPSYLIEERVIRVLLRSSTATVCLSASAMPRLPKTTTPAGLEN